MTKILQGNSETRGIAETKTYAGRISVSDYEDVGRSVFLSTLEKPLAKLLMNDIDGKFVSVRYGFVIRN